MADRRYILYDSLATGTAAFDTLLFQVASGADTTHTETFTNMRGAGSLPATEKFTLQRIGVVIPPTLAPADYAALLGGSLLQFRLLNQVLVWIPLVAAIEYSKTNAFYTLATAANQNAFGFLHDGFALDPAIDIAGGEKFDVRVKTTAATAASYTLVVCLDGILTF